MNTPETKNGLLSVADGTEEYWSGKWILGMGDQEIRIINYDDFQKIDNNNTYIKYYGKIVMR